VKPIENDQFERTENYIIIGLGILLLDYGAEQKDVSGENPEKLKE